LYVGLYSHNTHHPLPPLYALGGGSIGILFSTSMRIGAVSPPFAPCLLLRAHHRPNLRRYDADGGGYVLASLRRGYDASAFDASDRVVSVDVPARCIDTTSSSSSSWIRKLLLTTKAPSAAAASSSVLHLLHPTEPST